jgi:predicted lactoylglutathione lyase
MQPRISVITLGVSDLEKSIQFYRDGLGLSTEGIIGKEFEYGSVAFFDLENWLKLALWPRESISKDTGMILTESCATEFTLWYNLTNQQEVDTIINLAEKAGAKILKKPHKTFYGGYAWYFQDPDNHIWEIVFNPDFL